ncbi:MAG: ATP-grasp domain-containing protein [Polyangiaceae bacterium]
MTISRTILVTGVGGGVGQSICKSLQGSGYRVIGADAGREAAGLYAVDVARMVPSTQSPDYLDRILDICREESVSLAFPGLEPDLFAFSAGAARLREAGIVPVVSTPDIIKTCDDKLLTARFLEKNGFPAPRTVALAGHALPDLPLPFILKPKTGGARSIGVFVIRERDDFDYRVHKLDPDNYIAQELIEGPEYTCGTVNFDGKCHGTIVMRRTLRDGDTYKAFVEEDPELSAYLVRVAEALRPFGACNFQLRKQAGVPYIFEINARCSGTTGARTLAGFNEPKMIADHLLSGIAPSYEIRKIAILRYWKELVVDPARMDTLSTEGRIEGDGSRL